MSPAARVSRLSLTPVKGTRLLDVESVRLGPAGADGNRRFFVADSRNRMVNGKSVGELCQVVASLAGDVLTLELPDGTEVAEPVQLGGSLQVRFFSRMVAAREVRGPFAQALSATCGQPLRLVQAERTAVDRGAGGGVSLISRGSLTRLASPAGETEIDARRFRMLVEVEGIAAHEEDSWVGRRVRVGSAVVRFAGHVGRCLVTSRHPETGAIDLPTLELLRGYRGDVEATEPLPFGIYGAVMEPGEVRLGDPVG